MAAAALPTGVFAKPSALGARDRRILDIARAEVARAGSALTRRDIAVIADFGAHSAKERFHFANLENGTVRSFHVAHGSGSDRRHTGWLKDFSNVEGSNATSRGLYLTGERYQGKYGTSIRLDGMDRTNSNARDRAIVMHPAEYARPEQIERWGKLGRSWGCFAMGPDQYREALAVLSGKHLIYADKLDLA